MATFEQGKVAGKMHVANVRVTCCIPTLNAEIIFGEYPGYSSTGAYYDPKTKVFSPAPCTFDPQHSLKLECTQNEIILTQDHVVIKIPFGNDLRVCPLLGFKYCMLHIKQTDIRKLPEKTVHVSYAEALGQKMHSELPVCKSLTAELKDVKPKQTLQDQFKTQAWGKQACRFLKETK